MNLSSIKKIFQNYHDNVLGKSKSLHHRFRTLFYSATLLSSDYTLSISFTFSTIGSKLLLENRVALNSTNRPECFHVNCRV